MTLSRRSVTVLQTLALAPPVLVALRPDAVQMATLLAAAALASLAWETLFALLRRRSLTAHGLTTALVVALFCPADLALWHLVVAVSLGVVLGELVFGGRGFGFVSPAALSLSLLVVAFPGTALEAPTPEMALATLPGLALLLFTAGVSPAILLGVAIGALSTLAVVAQTIDPLATATALSLGTIFLIADPSAASTTPPGRWACGIVAGALAVVFSPALAPEAVVAAALLASVFAPLIDHVASLASDRTARTATNG